MPTVYQIEPSTGLGITAYGPEPGTMRLSLFGSIGWLGSTYSSSLPSPSVSSTNGAQPSAFCASPVSSITLLLSRPATGPAPLNNSVLSASKPNCRWCVEKHRSTNLYSIVFGSSLTVWRSDFSSGNPLAYGLSE